MLDRILQGSTFYYRQFVGWDVTTSAAQAMYVVHPHSFSMYLKNTAPRQLLTLVAIFVAMLDSLA